MKKGFISGISLLFFMLSFASSAVAGGNFKYVGGDDCVLKRFSDGKWETASPEQVGNEVLTLQTAKNSADYSTFKYKGFWYNAKNHCFGQNQFKDNSKDSRNRNKSDSSRSTTVRGKTFYIEPSATYYLMMGSGTAGADVTIGSDTLTTEAYKPSISFGGRIGYLLNAHYSIFGEFRYFSAKQDANYTVSSVAHAGSVKESVQNFNLGLQYAFSESPTHLFVSLSAGYSKLAGQTEISPVLVKYTSSSYNVDLEGGVNFDLSSHFSVLPSVSYNLLTFKKIKFTESNASFYPVGGDLDNSLGNSTLGFNLRIRYAF